MGIRDFAYLSDRTKIGHHHILEKWIKKLACEQRKQKPRCGSGRFDSAWSTFIRMLEYKCSQYGQIFLKVDPRRSSQTCSACGFVHPEALPLGWREVTPVERALAAELLLGRSTSHPSLKRESHGFSRGRVKALMISLFWFVPPEIVVFNRVIYFHFSTIVYHG